MLKVNNKDTNNIFIVNFEHISHLVLAFLLLTLNMELPAGNNMKLNEDKSYLFIVDHKHETVWANIDCSKIWES